MELSYITIQKAGFFQTRATIKTNYNPKLTTN